MPEPEDCSASGGVFTYWELDLHCAPEFYLDDDTEDRWTDMIQEVLGPLSPMNSVYAPDAGAFSLDFTADWQLGRGELRKLTNLLNGHSPLWHRLLRWAASARTLAKRRNTSGPSLDDAIARQQRYLTSVAHLLPKEIRSEVLASAGDVLRQEVQSPRQAGRVARRLIAGVVKVAVLAKLNRAPSSDPFLLWLLRLGGGAVSGLLTTVGLLAFLIQILGAPLTRIQLLAFVALMVIGALLGLWATARLDGQRRQP